MTNEEFLASVQSILNAELAELRQVRAKYEALYESYNETIESQNSGMMKVSELRPGDRIFLHGDSITVTHVSPYRPEEQSPYYKITSRFGSFHLNGDNRVPAFRG